MNNKVYAFVQARFNSSRFKGKILKKIKGKTLLEILIKRLKKASNIDEIVILTTKNKEDKKIIYICKKLNVSYFCGPENDVLERYYLAAKKFKAKNILRITSDCPLIDASVVDKIISKYKKSNYNYISNIISPTYPDGLDVEIFDFKSLEFSNKNAIEPLQREHVTKFILDNDKFQKYNVKFSKDYSSLRLTIDEYDDLILLKKIFSKFKNIYFSLIDILELYNENKKIFLINNHIKRNEGMQLNKGQKLWKKAKTIIPGGSMLFSKNPDLYLPKYWPAYFSKTNGCNVWDLENKKFIDLALMGIGTNILGYSNKSVDKKVLETIKLGNMSTLNCKEEVELAEKLVEMHPWSKMVRFARTGGEASSIAVRIARVVSSREKVAICGYHGWHDWYLSSNLNNRSSLDKHLMTDLSISGLPKNMKNLTFSFEYNNFEQLKKISNNHKLAAIVMEVSRNEKPKNNFLKKIRDLANKKNIVLIFDECTSGFRESFGGLHLKYKVNPDICILGKTLGNGYAVNAVVGREEVMKGFNKTFISSTFWTERIGSSAGIATLKEMEKIKSWKIISKLGKNIKKNWKKISSRNDLKLNIYGLDPLPKFDFMSENNLLYKTFISQEFLKKNILASNTIYLSISHDKKKIIQEYYSTLDQLFNKIKQYGPDIKYLLDGPVCINGLRDSK